MAMERLDVSEAVESDELRRFKTKVKVVARTYTNRFGWCGEVDRALRELGIDDESNLVEVEVRTSLTSVRVKSPPEKLDVPADEQQQVLAELVNGNEHFRALNLSITPEDVLEATLVVPSESYGDYHWRLMGEGGDRLHAFPSANGGISLCGRLTSWTRRGDEGINYKCLTCLSANAIN